LQLNHPLWLVLKKAADEISRAYEKEREESEVSSFTRNTRQNMTKQLQDELLPKLLQFERNEEYNICGDKALHMCILAAYTYEEKNPSRKFLLQLAKELIKELNEDENVNINNADTNTMGANPEQADGQDPPKVKAKYIDSPYINDLDVWEGIPSWPKDKDGGKNVLKRNTRGLYEGETILHMAIINGDVKYVQYLLEHGADVNARAVGVFFMPLVKRRAHLQGSGQTNVMAFFQNVDDTVGDSNTESAFEDPDLYFGQFPLSFACCVGHESILRVLYQAHKDKAASFVHADPVTSSLRNFQRNSITSNSSVFGSRTPPTDSLKKRKLARQKAGAISDSIFVRNRFWIDFINKKDDLGNTALHISVMHRQIHMVDWLMEHRASMRIMNKQGLTPFTLSVWLGNVEMYTHIANKFLGDLKWQYGPNCQLKYIDLEQIDSFRMRISQTSIDSQACKSISKDKGEQQEDVRREHPLHDYPGPERWRSAFEIIIEKELAEFANETIFNYLIESKWSAFAWWIYLFGVVGTYVAVLALFVAATLMRVQELSDARAVSSQTGFETAEVTGLEAFKNASGYMFLILASAGSGILLFIAWILLRVQYRDLDQNHDGKISTDEMMLFVFKNLSSVCCLAAFGLIEGIVAARHQGQLNLVCSRILCLSICGNWMLEA
jgi:hypothetical protein